jgi:16S rRNA (adenine1518-N6/adenine1519-N6)-dimethyltransferase
VSQQPDPARQRSRAQWQSVLRSRGIQPTRSMGQNFLVEPSIVTDIVDVAGVQNGDHVVEVGPGLGILTRELLRRGANVLAVELDRDLARFLEADLRKSTGLTLLERDARYVDIEPVIGKNEYRFVANLPYSTGTVIIRRFLELDHPPVTMTVMVQREVGERMIAEPPEMSLLGLAMQLYADASLAFVVPPDVFLPPPKVESAVVHLIPRTHPLLDANGRETLFRLATMAFQRKRKTINNGLAQGMELPKSDVDKLLEKAGIDSMRRPQTMSLNDWIALVRILS